MKVLVTGANGFLGRAIVAAAIEAGHDVTAMVRRVAAGEAGNAFDPGVRIIEGDLRARGDWCASVGWADVVVHAAAAAGGDRGVQLSNTIVGTENLLAALRAGSLTRLVHISSFSVYDYQHLSAGAVLDEEAALEQRPHERDAYTETKCVQERLVREWCEAEGVSCVVLRPGAIAGPDRAWGHGTALAVGPLSLVFAPRARFRLISVSDCARAIACALERPIGASAVLNLVGDDLPTHAQYFRKCRRAGAKVGLLVPVPWLTVASVGHALQIINRWFLGGRVKLPEILDLRRQQARWKPLHYPNDRARRLLGWRPEPLNQQLVDVMVNGPTAGSR